MSMEIYSPFPPSRYTRHGAGHGAWYADDIPTWNLVWLSAPNLDLYLDDSKCLTDVLATLDPEYVGTVAGGLDLEEVFPSLRTILGYPKHQFLKPFLAGPWARLPAYEAYGHAWIDTVRARCAETPVPNAISLANFRVPNVISLANFRHAPTVPSETAIDHTSGTISINHGPGSVTDKPGGLILTRPAASNEWTGSQSGGAPNLSRSVAVKVIRVVRRVRVVRHVQAGHGAERLPTTGQPALVTGAQETCTMVAGKSPTLMDDFSLTEVPPARSAESQFLLGKQYDNGDGVTRDYKRAVECYLEAANIGHSKAQNNLGVLYSQGLGVPIDEQKAAEWYLKAAEQGLDIAQCNIAAYLLEKDGADPFNAEQAAIWYRKAAEQGNSDAQCSLGSMFEAGMGVPQDDQLAKEFYLKAALKDDEEAQAWLWRRARRESAQQPARLEENPTAASVVDAPYRRAPDSACTVVRAAIELIKQSPDYYSAELEELQMLAPANSPTLSAVKMAIEPCTSEISTVEQTLRQVLAWLATQDRVSVASLRGHLLPLDQLPAVFMDELNEQALDLIGELALEEVGDEIIVARDVLATVIAHLE